MAGKLTGEDVLYAIVSRNYEVLARPDSVRIARMMVANIEEPFDDRPFAWARSILDAIVNGDFESLASSEAVEVASKMITSLDISAKPRKSSDYIQNEEYARELILKMPDELFTA